MPKHQAYPAAFREQLLAFVQAGRSPEELAKEFEPTAQTIRNWVAQSERDILSKAAAWFARETGTIPKASFEGFVFAVARPGGVQESRGKGRVHAEKIYHGRSAIAFLHRTLRRFGPVGA